MKRLYIANCLLLIANFSFSQAILYNGGGIITADVGSTIFVDGHVTNDVGGVIHNQGSIYLSRDWTNNDPAGALDPATGTVILNGTLTQTITGTQPTTFNTLDCQQGSKKMLKIDTYVGGTTGVLKLNSSPFALNSNTLFVTNPQPSAVTRTTGYIISETEPMPTGPGYGTVEWRIGNSGVGSNYIYPFGTTSGTYVPFNFVVQTAGVQSGTGAMAVSTYPTLTSASPNNRPLPTTVTNLDDVSNTTTPEAAEICADRFWITDALNYTTKPKADITFTYADAEWNTSGGSNNNINEDSLKAWRWNGSQWLLPATGIGIPGSNQVLVSGVNTFSIWTLKGVEPVPIPCGDFFLPNAFSPNGDSHNDVFIPRNNCITQIDFRIYNRWGNLVFETNTPGKGWDGSSMHSRDVTTGVYAYEIKATIVDLNGATSYIDQKGTVTLLK